MQEELEDAHRAGLVPHTLQARDRGAAAAARAVAARWPDGLLVIGEPGAIAAARLLAEGTPAEASGRRVWFADGPDAPTLSALADRRPHLVLLDGPDWVRQLGVSLHAVTSGATVFSGDGTERDGWTLPAAPRIDGIGASDARFGVLGAASLALTAAVGGDVDAVMEAAERMADRCAAAALFDNPALNLAAVSWALALDHRLFEPVFSVDGPRLEAWAAVVARAWGAITSGTPGSAANGDLRRAGGFFPRVTRAGDEAQMARLLDGPSDAWVISVTAEPPPTAEPTPGAELRARLDQAQHRLLIQGGVPALRLRLGRDDAPTLAGATLLFLHAATALAVLRDVDPLAIPAADRLRELQDPSFGDNGAR